LDEAYKAAEICALNCLTAIKSVVGSLEKVEEIVQVHGFINLADGFHHQPTVIDGAGAPCACSTWNLCIAGDTRRKFN